MTKAELIRTIHRKHGKNLTKKKVSEITDAIFGELGNYFVRQKITKKNGAPKFTYPGFGTLTKRWRNARLGMNPRTREPMMIPVMQTISFQVGKELRKRLNK